MKYSLIPILLTLVFGLLPAQAVVLQETFDTTWSTFNPPPGWRIAFTEPPSTSDWHRAPDGGQNPWEQNPTPYALLWNAPSRAISDSLITPVMDCSGLAGIMLRCSTALLSTMPRLFTAEIIGSTNGGSSWDFQVRSYPSGTSVPPTPETLDMVWAGGHDQVQLAWVFVGLSGNFGYWAVDNVTVTGVLPGADVGATRIIAPVDTVDSGLVVTPSAVVRNLGVTSASFGVRFRIGTLYNAVEIVNNLAPADSAVVEFAPWTAVEGGPLAVTCSTELTGDIHPDNDARYGSVTVLIPWPDAGVVSLLAPGDTLDTLQTVTPGARVRNSGVLTVSFPVVMRIGARYADTQFVADLNPGTGRDIAFRQWRPEERGNLSVRCSTMLPDDRDPRNDTLGRFTFARVRDAGVARIVAPRGVVMENATVLPSVLVANYGNTVESPQAVLQLTRGPDTIYADFQQFTLQPGEQDTVVFASWFAAPVGGYGVVSYTLLSGDAHPENDRDSVSFIVTVGISRDAGVTRIVRPRGHAPVGSIQPSAQVMNFGQGAAAFRVHMAVRDGATDVYRDSVDVEGLAGGEQATVVFPDWQALPGRYSVLCSAALAGDTFAGNDFLSDSVVVESLTAGWAAQAPMPEGSRQKGIKDGGALATGSGADRSDDYIYALKGNNTCEFYGYDPALAAWSARESVPILNRVNKKKAVKKGSTLAGGTDGAVYAAKGNGTLDWWQYDPVGRVWTQKADVPAGAKACKEGVSSAAVRISNRNYVYLLKGSGTFEFYRYDAGADTWETMAPALGGASGKAYKNGSSIAYDGDDTIFCLKGTYNEFAAYSISGRNWVTKETLPRVFPGGAKKTKVKDGSQTACAGRSVFALKGGNTDEFWQYRCDESQWSAATVLPAGTKRVKGGGALVYVASSQMFYALRGNGTREFWRYFEPPVTGVAEKPQSETVRQAGLTIAPNPLSGMTSISYILARGGDVSLRLYDITGKLVGTLASGYRPAGSYSYSLLTTHYSLVRGVYLLKLESDGRAVTRKLVVE